MWLRPKVHICHWGSSQECNGAREGASRMEREGKRGSEDNEHRQGLTGGLPSVKEKENVQSKRRERGRRDRQGEVEKVKGGIKKSKGRKIPRFRE